MLAHINQRKLSTCMNQCLERSGLDPLDHRSTLLFG
jgi:hypothetical protein